MPQVHESKVGTYHPPEMPEFHTGPGNTCESGNGAENGCARCAFVAWTVNDTRGCIDDGPSCDACRACCLSFAFICLDGGDSLCEGCAEKAGVTIVPCDCD